MLTETKIKNYFIDSELKYYFEVCSEVRWRSAHDFVVFDIALYHEGSIYAIVEVKSNVTSNSFENAKIQIERAIKLAHCRFGIITDGSTYHLIDTALSSWNYTKMSFDELVAKLIHPEKVPQTEDGMSNIKEAMKTIFEESKIQTICNNIVYDSNQNCYTFNSLENERNFFLRILNNPNLNHKKRIYRYTSFETLFAMLNKGTYRMSGIVGMNDKSETDYFEKKSALNTIGSSVRDLNDSYLSSCTSLKDYLTMWRLYGNDGKGVCLEFKILHERKRLNNFILAPINYAETRKKHKVVESLKKLSDANMRFSELYKWKHFFKPYDYNVEEEIRLIFFDNGRFDNGVIKRDWIQTLTHSIINPIIDFKLNSSGFPLQLTQIILGPKMQESKIQKSQLEDLISEKGYSIKVSMSSIKNYR